MTSESGLPDLRVPQTNDPASNRRLWMRRRREWISLFEQHVYGKPPPWIPQNAKFQPLTKAERLWKGRATRRKVRALVEQGSHRLAFDVHIFIPSRKPTGCFLLPVHREREILEQAESQPCEFWPVQDIVERGFATVAFHVEDIAPDDAARSRQEGILSWAPATPIEDSGDRWGAIAAWAWAASRVLDHLTAEADLKDVPMSVIGHSRGGKTALWCGALDNRIALTVSNESGRNGAALGRVSRGETIDAINRTFPHWFCTRHKFYSSHPEALPVDQHALLALLAPRLAYIASASDDAHADPFAEFSSGIHAEPAFQLFGKSGIVPNVFPKDGARLHEGHIGYHLRPGGHDLLKEDWHHILDFAERHWSG